ncbi:DUF4249 domain-containing protein [Ferruginibacter sp.]
MKTALLLLSAIVLLSSCEKNINFNLKNADDVLVVDAQIENGQAPMVVLSKSMDYFSTISPQILASSFVRNADVTISNGTLTHKLKEYAYPLGGGYTAYYYSVDPASPSTSFIGEFNKKYTLNIKAEGQEYTAQTNIPVLAKYPDSLWFKKAPLNPDTNKRVLMSRTTDPPGLGNYIRYFTKKNSGVFLPGPNSVFDDAVIDGTTYEVQVEPGIDRNNSISADSNFFRKGDTVTVKLCNIDKASYTFWNTWEFAQQSIGNPFAQPNKVIGNISNNALGAFCGYAVWYGTIIAK